MDRFRSSHPAGFAAVRIAAGGPFERVLHAGHQRVPGESEADAPHRRAVFEDPLLRFAAHDVATESTGLCRQPQARRPPDAGDGPAGDVARPAHEPSASHACDIPVFIAWNEDRRALRGVERRHYAPASLFVIDHIQPVYACPCFQEGIVCAPKPAQPSRRGWRVRGCWPKWW